MSSVVDLCHGLVTQQLRSNLMSRSHFGFEKPLYSVQLPGRQATCQMVANSPNDILVPAPWK